MGLFQQTKGDKALNRHSVIAIIGPTASGKSKLAMDLAINLKGEILCLDSTSIYKGFDIGSDKPSSEDQKKVPHHLIDILDPKDTFSAHHFVEQALAKIQEIIDRKKTPMIVGGSYFYLRALQHGMYSGVEVPSSMVESIEEEFIEKDLYAAVIEADPALQGKIHPNDRYRLIRALSIFRATGKKPSELKPDRISDVQKNLLWTKYAIAISRHELTQQIMNRTDGMLRKGWVEEAKGLYQKFPDSRAFDTIGYAQLKKFMKGEINEQTMRNEIIDKTRGLAKRQITWLRSDPEVRYVDHRDTERILFELNNLKVAMGAT